MNKFLRDEFRLNAIRREVEYTNRAVNNGNDSLRYIEKGRRSGPFKRDYSTNLF